MWLFTSAGMFSAVETFEDASMLQIRARDKGDLENLRKYIKKMRIIKTPFRDYPYRIIIRKTKWAAVMAQLANDIDYTNFKDSVKKTDPTRASIYTGIWSRAIDIGDGAYGGWGNWDDDLYGVATPSVPKHWHTKRHTPRNQGSDSKLFVGRSPSRYTHSPEHSEPPKTFIDTGDGNLQRIMRREDECPNCQWPIDDGCMCKWVTAAESEGVRD